MKYKAIATDLDGTLLNDDKQISEVNRKAIDYAVSKGIIIIPCTGRAVQGITRFEVLRKLNSLAVAYNGGMITSLKDGSTVYHCPLFKNDAEFIINTGLDFDTNICVWIDNRLFCNKINTHTLSYSRISDVPPVKFDSFSNISDRIVTKVLWYDEEQKIQNYLSHMSNKVSQQVTCCTSKPWFLEFFNSRTSKALALEKICGFYGISKNEIIAIGDELNDISMLKAAGLSVAVENAADDVKKAADIITASNNDDGFAKLIYNIF